MNIALWVVQIILGLALIAALGLGIVMILAAVFHAKRKENQAIGMNIVFLALAIFVAIGRY
jgi:ABC-type Na+ efflux pump permease subunit